MPDRAPDIWSGKPNRAQSTLKYQFTSTAAPVPAVKFTKSDQLHPCLMTSSKALNSSQKVPHDMPCGAVLVRAALIWFLSGFPTRLPHERFKRFAEQLSALLILNEFYLLRFPGSSRSNYRQSITFPPHYKFQFFSSFSKFFCVLKSFIGA